MTEKKETKASRVERQAAEVKALRTLGRHMREVLADKRQTVCYVDGGVCRYQVPEIAANLVSSTWSRIDRRGLPEEIRNSVVRHEQAVRAGVDRLLKRHLRAVHEEARAHYEREYGAEDFGSLPAGKKS